MKWDVEYTDEFGQWWETLQEMEQASIDAGVTLLEDYGPNYIFHTQAELMAQSMAICEICAFSTKDGLIGYCMHLTRVAVQFCSWEEIRRAMTDGTIRTCRLQIDYMTII